MLNGSILRNLGVDETRTQPWNRYMYMSCSDLRSSRNLLKFSKKLPFFQNDISFFVMRSYVLRFGELSVEISNARF